MNSKSNIGLIGLAVMGENLALNMERNGWQVSVWNRTTEVVDNFINGRAKGKNIVDCESLEDFTTTLETPRIVNYFYSLTTDRLPANLIQAQRDYFGAHTFERVDEEPEKFFHENWTGHGGNTKSGTYNA